jgi:hypothetical protein
MWMFERPGHPSLAGLGISQPVRSHHAFEPRRANGHQIGFAGAVPVKPQRDLLVDIDVKRRAAGADRDAHFEEPPVATLMQREGRRAFTGHQFPRAVRRDGR